METRRLIRDLLHEELRRGLGRHSRRSEREGSVSSSSSQEGSRSSCSHSVRHSRSPSSSRRSRSSSRHSSRSHAPSHSSHVSGGSSCHPVAVAALLGGLPSARLARAPLSPPPMFIMPLGPAPPPYTSHQLLLLFPSMMPPPRYVSPSPSHIVMGPNSSCVAVDASVTYSRHR